MALPLSERPVHQDETGMERLVFFSDAVFAIAITLLALEIRLPEAEYRDGAALLTALENLWPSYLSYAISFLAIGGYWLAHHRMFRGIAHYDRRLLALNLLLLMSIAFIPFPTTVLSHSGSAVATIFYAATMTVTGLVSALIWGHASARGRLLAHKLTSREYRRGWLRMLAAPAIFALSIPLALVNSDLARLSWLLIAGSLTIQAHIETP